MQARVKRRDYESTPIASANRIKRAWEGGNHEKPGVEIQVPNEQREIVLQAVKDYAEKEGIPVVESAHKHGQDEEALEKRRKEREEARKVWAADVIIKHKR